MAFAQLEDLSGTLELVIFPRVYEEAKPLLAENALLLVHAKVDWRDEQIKLIAEAIEPYKLPQNARKRLGGGSRKPKHLRVEIPLGQDERAMAEMVGRVFNALTEFQGDVPFTFYLQDRHGRIEMDFPNVATSYSPQLEQRIVALVGPGRLVVEWA